jgi:hypothetical protein
LRASPKPKESIVPASPLTAMALKSHNPSDILATLPRGAAPSQWSARTTSAWNALIGRLEKDHSSRSKGRHKHRSKTPKRRRPSSAAACLRSTKVEMADVPKARASTAPCTPCKVATPVNRTAGTHHKAACGAAHQAVRGARSLPSSIGSSGRRKEV